MLLHDSEKPERGALPAFAEVSLGISLGVAGNPKACCDVSKPVTLIGSRRDCQLAISHPDVSKVHAAVVHTGSHLLVCDLRSRTGTFVNDRLVSVAALSPGDVLRVGSVVLETKGLRELAAKSAGRADRSSDPVRLTHPLQLRFGNRCAEITKNCAVIGRRNTCDVVINTPDMSLAHALIFEREGRLAVFDLGSRSGTRLNGRRTPLAWLAHGDELTAGGVKLRVSWRGQAGVNDRAAEEPADAIGAESEVNDLEQSLSVVQDYVAAAQGKLDERAASLDQRQSELDALAKELEARQSRLETERTGPIARGEEVEKTRVQVAEQTRKLADAAPTDGPKKIDFRAGWEKHSPSSEAGYAANVADAGYDLPAPIVNEPLFGAAAAEPPTDWPDELRERFRVLRRTSEKSDREVLDQVWAESASQPAREPRDGPPPKAQNRKRRWWS